MICLVVQWLLVARPAKVPADQKTNEQPYTHEALVVIVSTEFYVYSIKMNQYDSQHERDQNTTFSSTIEDQAPWPNQKGVAVNDVK
jgi:hypothetical protein